MGYVGNINGPRKSEIVRKLGASYFGISDEELDKEIQIYLDEEYSGEIDPIQLDENKKPYLLFYGPEKIIQKFYLDSAGYKLTGKVKASINNEEREITLED
jgi:hypothetical protein